MVTTKFRWPREAPIVVVPFGTTRSSRERVIATASMSKRRQEGSDETTVRKRILEAAFAAFMKSGYAAASTLEIATRARVSKRELYALVGNKQKMLITCIRERAKRLEVPAHLPVVHDRETLAQVRASFGTKLVREVSDPSLGYSDWRSPRRSTPPRWRVPSTLQDARQAAPPCVKSWPRPRRPGCSQAARRNLPGSSQGYSGAI